jgi:hypothetical protein
MVFENKTFDGEPNQKAFRIDRAVTLGLKIWPFERCKPWGENSSLWA